MDLAVITNDWSYDADDEHNNIRKITGIDGAVKLQIRLQNGIVQWEAEGRPDGDSPHGCDTVLEYCEELVANRHKLEEEPGEFTLPEHLVDELGDELQSYDRRRQIFMLIRDYRHARRDAIHGLSIIEMVGEYGDDPSAKLRYERQRPSLIADRARSQALLDIQEGEFKRALLALTGGIRQIERNFQRLGIGSEVRHCEDRKSLIDFRRSLREHCHVPMTDGELLQSLRSEQKIAIQCEDYEMAGRLRDKITRLRSRMGTRESG